MVTVRNTTEMHVVFPLTHSATEADISAHFSFVLTPFPPRRPGFDPRSGHLGFVVDKVVLGQVFSEYFGFPCQSSFHRLLHTHHLSSGAGTTGQILADVPSGLSLTPPRETKKQQKNPTLYPSSPHSPSFTPYSSCFLNPSPTPYHPPPPSSSSTLYFYSIQYSPLPPSAYFFKSSSLYCFFFLDCRVSSYP
jgi:hypothetical protein